MEKENEKDIQYIAEEYNQKIYINVKYKNKYVENEEGKKINGDIIRTLRNSGGYNSVLLNKTTYLNSYDNQWKNASELRNIIEEHGTLGIVLRLGGGDAFSSSWEYTIDFDDVYAINLTEIFGAGNEPTKEQMDEIFNNF